jgi:hypothetical protein
MKQIWPNYSYSPTTNVLTLTGLNIDRDQLLLVTAADRGRIMYNFADSSVTASAFTSGANTALTLVATTAGLTTTAALVIYYDDQLASTTVTVSSIPAISGTVTASISGAVFANGSGEGATPNEAVAIGWVEETESGANFNFASKNNPLPISGTVTANPTGTQTIVGSVTIGAGTAQIGSVTASISNFPATQAVSLTTLPALVAGTAQIGSVTASISNSLTISSLPAISGTVSIGNLGDGINTFWADNAVNDITSAVNGGIGTYISDNDALPISGTVTANAFGLGQITELPALIPVMNFTDPIGDSSIGNIVPIQITNQNGTVDGNNPLPISGTVTANLSISSTAITSGSFTSLASATLVPANTARKMATVYNLGAGQLFINAGATATTLGGGFMVALSSGDFYECDYTTTTLSAIFATAGTASWVSH